MKRILQIQPYASLVGGVDTVVLELVKGLAARGYQLHVALPGPSPYVERYEAAGAAVHFVPLAVFGKPTSPAYYPANFLKLFSTIRGLNALIRHLKIDLVHTHKMEAPGGNISAQICGVPAVQTVHEIPNRFLWGYQLVGAIDHLFADKIIVLCDASKRMFTWAGRQSQKLTKIYNGITTADETMSGGEEVRRELGIGPGDPVVLSVARISPMKGLEYLIEAAPAVLAQHPNAHVLIAGGVAFDRDESYFQELQRSSERPELNGRVRFLGLRRDVPRLMAAADLFVLPSVYDIFPTVLLEAMRAGRAVVATSVGGVPEIVRDSGLLAPSRDSRSLACAINTLLGDPERRRSMGESGARLVRSEFSFQQYIDGTEAVYRRLLDGK